jgi:hypothetical protein
LEHKSIETNSVGAEPQHPSAGSNNPSSGTGWLVVFWVILIGIGMVYLFFSWLVSSDRGPDLMGIIYFSSLVPICCFAGAYAGLGNHPLRWPAVLIVGPLIGWYASFSLGGNSLPEFEAFCLGIMGIVASTTLVLRRWKGTLRPVATGGLHSDGLQFGIKDLLIWTTVAAILVAIGQALFKYSENNNAGRIDEYLMILGLSISLAIATVVNIWALFGNQVTALKLLTVVLMTFGSAASCYWLYSMQVWFFAMIAIANQFVVVALMLALRKSGYRFVKRLE